MVFLSVRTAGMKVNHIRLIEGKTEVTWHCVFTEQGEMGKVSMETREQPVCAGN